MFSAKFYGYFCVALCSAVAAMPSRGVALDLSVGFKASANVAATAGLDEPTRKLIEALPVEIRQQVIKLLQEALPLLDKSVQLYIGAVNDILDKQINHLECAAIGTGGVLFSGLKSSLPFSSAPAPVSDLNNNKSKVISSFNKNTSPVDYERSYSDLLYRTAVTYCQVSISPEASLEVSQIQNEIRPKWNVWHRLNGKCPDAKTCYLYLYTTVNSQIKDSDVRDLQSSHAIDDLKEVSAPPEPGFFSKWNPTAYELALSKIFTIQSTIEVSRQVRLGLAKSYIDAAEEAVKAAENHITASRKSISASDKDSNIRAETEARSAVSDNLEIQKYIYIGEKTSQKQKLRGDTLITRMQSVSENFIQLIATSIANNNAIEARRQKEASDAAQREVNRQARECLRGGC